MKQPIRLPQSLEKPLRRLLARMGVAATSHTRLSRLLESEQAAFVLNLLTEYPPDQAALALSMLKKSKSQFRQDLFALLELRFKRGGFFVEFGAADGIAGSNTWLLEKEFGWSGILAEPARVWHEGLSLNRHCSIERRCVWARSGETLAFNEVDNAQLSTIDLVSPSDDHAEARRQHSRYDVETISLGEMLENHRAPGTIHYLSVDTEGSEYEILSHFDFSKYEFRVITVEHNYMPVRDSLRALLRSKGYIQKFPQLSLVDDWFVQGGAH